MPSTEDSQDHLVKCARTGELIEPISKCFETFEHCLKDTISTALRVKDVKTEISVFWHYNDEQRKKWFVFKYEVWLTLKSGDILHLGRGEYGILKDRVFKAIADDVMVPLMRDVCYYIAIDCLNEIMRRIGVEASDIQRAERM